MSEQSQGVVIDVNNTGTHVPEKELTVWRCGEGSSVDKSIVEIYFINKLFLSVNYRTSEESLKEFVSISHVCRFTRIKHNAHNRSLELFMGCFVKIQVNNMELQRKVSSVVGVL